MFKRTLTAVILSVLTAFSYAGADSYLHDHPAKISIIVDTSNSMLGVDGSTLKQKSVIVREALGQVHSEDLPKDFDEVMAGLLRTVNMKPGESG